MSQSRKNDARFLRGLSAAVCSLAVLCVMDTPAQAQSALTHHVRQSVTSGEAQFLNPLPATQSLRLHIMLPLRNQAGLDQFLKDLYDPASPEYRRFLTVSEFTAQFGPAEEDYSALTRYATSNGLKIVGGSRDGMDLQIEGSVAVIEAALHVNMGVYQHPTENRTFFAPDREPTVGLPFPLWHVSGLDNYSLPHPAIVHNSDRSPSRAPSVSQPIAATGSGPSASYLGSDMRAAYYGGTALTGAGQNLGLLEFYGTDLADLTTYFKNIGQTNNVPVTLLSTDGTSTTCLKASGCSDVEQTIDMTQALGMAPGLAGLVMYIGTIDSAILSAMTTHSPLSTTISCSWIWGPADAAALDPYFQKMAAQGQNFFIASGDNSNWSKSNPAWPADDANVISVGGTNLTTTGPGGAWKSETAWSNSGGGISPDNIAIPSWQKLVGVITAANGGSTALRNGPDVAANSSGSYYVCADQTSCTANEYGGTSFAAPLWAGYMALVNQQAVANGHTTLGFINPDIYSYGVSSSYASDFHDITSGTSGSYSAGPGYDLVTGWGSPNGAGLIATLAAISTAPNFSITASSASISLAQGGKGTATITTAVSGGFKSTIALSLTGEPTGVTVTFSSASIAAPGTGTSTMTVAVATGAAPGAYTIIVTGTGGGVSHTAAFSLLIAVPAFTLTVAPTSITVAQGAKSTSSITTAVSGGFSSAVGLTTSGLPTGVTAAFSAASIAAPGSGTSTLTLTAASSAAAGTYTITVTGTGGGLTHAATVSLTVTTPEFTLSASPASISVTQGAKSTDAIAAAVSGGFSSAVALSVSGLPTGVTAAFSPASIAAPGSGTSTLTLSATSTAATGTHTLTVTGTGGGLTHTATITLIVSAPPSFGISVAPTSVSITPGARTASSTTLTTTVSSGFDSTITVTLSGLPAGTIAAFSPPSATAPGSIADTLTLSAGASSKAGTYPVTVTATGGGLSHTATLSLKVN